MKTYTATAPDGTKFTRKSKKTYTHAVIYIYTVDGSWGLNGFCGSKSLADKSAKAIPSYFGVKNITVVEATASEA